MKNSHIIGITLAAIYAMVIVGAIAERAFGVPSDIVASAVLGVLWSAPIVALMFIGHKK